MAAKFYWSIYFIGVFILLQHLYICEEKLQEIGQCIC